MLSSFERLIAFRYLRARRAEGFISVIAGFSLAGIALGVATLIVVLSVMRGVRGEMIESIIGLEGHVTVQSQGRGIEDYESLAAQLAAIPGVTAALPKVEGQVMLSYRGQAAGAMVAAYRDGDLARKTLLKERLGAFSAGIPEGQAVIGSRMAERLGIHPGDAVTLISPEGRATPAGMIPRIKAYTVAGTFTIGMYAYDNGLILLPFDEAQVYFKLKNHEAETPVPGEAEPGSLLNAEPRIPNPGKASVLEIAVADADDAPRIAQEIARSLPPGFLTYDWKASNNQIFRAVMVQRNVFFLILTLIILVASFNIIASLIMLVREKERAVAILRTMGATRGAILRIFITCGASIGVVGTLLGVALGLLLAYNTVEIQHALEALAGHKLLADELYFLSSLPAKVDAGEVLAVALMSLSLSLLATIYPARRAASINPGEALRYE